MLLTNTLFQLIDGIDIRQLNIQWLRSCLGLVSQEPILFDLTISQNITYGLENISEDEIIQAAIKANIHHFIQQLPMVNESKKLALKIGEQFVFFRAMKQTLARKVFFYRVERNKELLLLELYFESLKSYFWTRQQVLQIHSMNK